MVLVLLDEQSFSPEDTFVGNQVEELIPSHIRHSIRHIYIDIGCFNGETIEYFLYFTPNSEAYEIYTFEPDPNNYFLCKKRLSQPKFAKYKINIIRKVAWIHDEKVLYRTERGRQSRISLNATDDLNESVPLQAIDFSAWLVRLTERKKVYVHIKMSMPGAEVPVLDKMIRDNALGLANKYEVEWTDRENPLTRATRIYIQFMFDSYGFDCLYYTRLQDMRKVYLAKGSVQDIERYYDWNKISESDAFAHYMERPDEPIRRDI
ncbi:unnamed protein product [Adineta ricciae]|uniref:Methyltransferase FkbM domain-containing protein n=1 Tax=Adineta ricciae TaxID=249248 RepID=A0A815EPF4_ADIRI|nr:unnamed protein product [Adineta ricciae]